MSASCESCRFFRRNVGKSADGTEVTVNLCHARPLQPLLTAEKTVMFVLVQIGDPQVFWCGLYRRLQFWHAWTDGA